MKLDSGDLFQFSEFVSEREFDSVKEKSILFIKGYNKLGYQAYQPGDKDLKVLGVEFLKEMAGLAQFPFVCANLEDMDGKPVFKPFTVVEVAESKFGVLGVVTGQAQVKEGDKYKVIAPIDAVGKYLPELEGMGLDAIILLAHMDSREVTPIMEAHKTIDLGLGGQHMIMSNTLEKIGDGWWAEPGQRGQHIIAVVFHLPEGVKRPFVVREGASKLKEELQNLDRQIQNFSRMVLNQGQPGTRGDPVRLQNHIKSLVAQRDRLKEKVATIVKPDDNSPFLAIVNLAVDRDLADDEEIKKWIDEYEAKQAGVNPRDAAARERELRERMQTARKLTPATREAVLKARAQGAAAASTVAPDAGTATPPPATNP